jgi:hypothetical protein
MRQNKRISEPWIAEIEFKFNNQYYSLSSICDDTNDIFINLVNTHTGEIRQKKVLIDQLARRLFESEIKNRKDIEIEDNI